MPCVQDSTTGARREVLTQPLSNYNIVVLDQSLKNNSYVSLVNTNVTRAGSTYDANVTGGLFRFANKANSYALDGRVMYSNRRGKAFNSTATKCGPERLQVLPELWQNLGQIHLERRPRHRVAHLQPQRPGPALCQQQHFAVGQCQLQHLQALLEGEQAAIPTPVSATRCWSARGTRKRASTWAATPPSPKASLRTGINLMPRPSPATTSTRAARRWAGTTCASPPTWASTAISRRTTARNLPTT